MLLRRYDPYEEFEKLRDLVITLFPYLSPLVRRVNPIFIKARNFTATVVEQVDKVIINVNWWKRLSKGEKAFILLHETLHLALQHGTRGRKYSNPYLYNVAADAIVNEMILQAIREAEGRGIKLLDKIRPPFPLVCYYILQNMFNIDIPYERFIKMSADELYFLLLRKARHGKMKNIDIIRDVVDAPPREARQVASRGKTMSEQSGSTIMNVTANTQQTEQARGTGNTNVTESNVNDMVKALGETMQLLSLYKAAGRGVESLCKTFERLLEPRIDWRSLIKRQLELALHGKIISTWRRPNKKLDDLPGKRYLAPTIVNIYCLVDVSGSILSEPNLLEQFFTEVAIIARTVKSRIILITWSSKVKKVINIDNPDTVMDKLREAASDVGGGTIIDDALRKAIELARTSPKTRNVLILLSDGIWNNDDPNLFKEVENYFTTLIYVYTIEPHPELRNWARINLTVS
ncbi:MAG: VWA domain-containing protein [Crenarchaeota archaeon]|nr:VWA domain-containing protein [Thermoproteota archaeon]